MDNLGNKIKKERIKNNLKQSELAKILCVSEKTISSWENNRTLPDLNMIYKISDYFKKSFYDLIASDLQKRFDEDVMNDRNGKFKYINDEFYEGDTNEIEIKLKIDNKEYNRIFNLISKNSNAKKITKQIDTYYSFIDNNWLRTRNENGKYIFSYKKKIDKNHYEKYDILVDNIVNLNKILSEFGVREIGIIEKNRTSYIYKNKYKFSFDNVKDIGLFIEIENINKSGDYKKDVYDLLNIIKSLNIDLNTIDRRKYINIYEKKRTD